MKKLRSYFKSPVGYIEVCVQDDCVERISFLKSKPSYKPSKERLVNKAVNDLKRYFSGRLKSLSLPFVIQGTDFELEVWRAISKIPYGKTRSYSAIAKSIGRPKAVRAVGGACNKNPLPLLIPCHRVISSSGGLTGFAAGLKAKSILLDIEQRLV